MLQESKTIQQKHEEFIKKVCETQKVWALENEDGFATSGSNEYEDEEGEPVEMICFWSTEGLAKSCAIEDWNDYTPVEMPLGNFIENFCIGMSNDGLLIGANFDQNMEGYEVDPLDLIIEIGDYIKNNNIEIELEHFKKFKDLVDQVKKALEEE
jgi:hypothetical protein